VPTFARLSGDRHEPPRTPLPPLPSQWARDLSTGLGRRRPLQEQAPDVLLRKGEHRQTLTSPSAACSPYTATSTASATNQASPEVGWSGSPAHESWPPRAGWITPTHKGRVHSGHTIPATRRGRARSRPHRPRQPPSPPFVSQQRSGIVAPPAQAPNRCRPVRRSFDKATPRPLTALESYSRWTMSRRPPAQQRRQ
jgi:hypothetical protein